MLFEQLIVDIFYAFNDIYRYCAIAIDLFGVAHEMF